MQGDEPDRDRSRRSGCAGRLFAALALAGMLLAVAGGDGLLGAIFLVDAVDFALGRRRVGFSAAGLHSLTMAVFVFAAFALLSGSFFFAPLQMILVSLMVVAVTVFVILVASTLKEDEG